MSHPLQGIQVRLHNLPQRGERIPEGERLSPGPEAVLFITPDHRDYEALVDDNAAGLLRVVARIELVFHGGPNHGLPVPPSRPGDLWLYGQTTIAPWSVRLREDGKLAARFYWHNLRIMKPGWFRFRVTFAMGHHADPQPYAPVVLTVEDPKEFEVVPGAWSMFPS